MRGLIRGYIGAIRRPCGGPDWGQDMSNRSEAIETSRCFRKLDPLIE